MSASGVESGGSSVTDRELRAVLDGIFEPGGGTITGLRRTPFGGATSFPAELVELRTDTGRDVRLFLKDLSSSRLPKEGLEARRRREHAVYRDVLSHVETGTARYYGAVHDESRGRLCLLLEYVGGTTLESLEFDHWVFAAHWLGRFQGTCAARELRSEERQVLVAHDGSYFHSTAERAQSAVNQVSTSLGVRLARALRDYDLRISAMTAQPRTVVHGSFRPSNILVDARTPPPRVCPVDWELAAWGSPLYDLAFLADGCGLPDLGTYWQAYTAGAAAEGMGVPPLGEVRWVLDSFYLHKLLKALSEAVDWQFPESTVTKFVELAEQRVQAS